MSFSSCATSHCCLFDFQPSSLVFESQGASVSYPCWEKKGDLVYLKEHVGLRGLFPQRGGYESECHSDSTHSHTASASACCQVAPVSTSSPLPPPSSPSSCNPKLLLLPHTPLFLCLVCTFFLIIATIPSRTFPSSPAGSVLPYREWGIAWFGGWLLFQSHLRYSEGPVK